MFSHFSHMRRLEEARRLQEKRKNQATFAAGISMGIIVGYCANKFLAPKIQESNYKERIGEGIDSAKEALGHVADSAVDFKDKVVQKVESKFDKSCCTEEDPYREYSMVEQYEDEKDRENPYEEMSFSEKVEVVLDEVTEAEEDIKE